jgi:SAM-dependent methyltransferase
MSEVRKAVRSHYAGAAKRIEVVQAGAAGACCAEGPDCGCECVGAYSHSELAEVGLSEAVSLGCGNPTLLANLEPGQVVLDLGSGAGLDVLLSARRVLPGGHVYGVDMTDEMLDLANRNQEKAGISNATFLKSAIENVPLPDGSVDVVISNCVINLAENKSAVIREAFRVLKPRGLFAVADMVEVEPLAPEIKKTVDSWAGCITGTISVDEYRATLLAAGFENPEIDVHSVQAMPGNQGKVGSAYIRALKPIVSERGYSE